MDLIPCSVCFRLPETGFALPLVTDHSTQTCPILKGSLPPALSLEIKEWKESDQMNSEWMPFACTT